MGMIFDKFATKVDAKKFADYIKNEHVRTAKIYTSQKESNRADPFPFRLDGPIVIVQRYMDDSIAVEKYIEKSVVGFGGRFAGT